jgi:hypothetical protein
MMYVAGVPSAQHTSECRLCVDHNNFDSGAQSTSISAHNRCLSQTCVFESCSLSLFNLVRQPRAVLATCILIAYTLPMPAPVCCFSGTMADRSKVSFQAGSLSHKSGLIRLHHAHQYKEY